MAALPDPELVRVADSGEAARLRVLADYLDGQPETTRHLAGLCEIAALVCDVPVATVNLIGAQVSHQLAAYGPAGGSCSRGDSMCALAIAAGEDLAVADASRDPRFATNPWVDGRLGQVRCYAASPVRTPAGHLLGSISVSDEVPRELSAHRLSVLAKVARQVEDVLELHLRGKRLERSVAELQRSHGQLAAFAGELSHDLKTPLTATIGFAELLEELPAVATDATALAFAQRCSTSSKRMLTMIDEMLAYASFGGALNRCAVPLDDVMAEVVGDLGAAAAVAEISWSGVDVVADRAQLRVLLQNLVDNAARYGRPGPRTHVEVRSIATADGVEIVVADNGTGIPANRRADVLVPLTRLRRDIPGTGLGLAICAQIASAHGGTLDIGATPGGGTTVTVRLPR